jgi:hypothetical protein
MVHCDPQHGSKVTAKAIEPMNAQEPMGLRKHQPTSQTTGGSTTKNGQPFASTRAANPASRPNPKRCERRLL